MSASESGATITQATGDPDVDGRSVGAKGAASDGSGAGRAGPAGSAVAERTGPRNRRRTRLEARRAQDGKMLERKKVTAYGTSAIRTAGTPR